MISGLAPFWNIGHNLSALYQATRYQPAEQGQNTNQSLISINSEDSELYKYLSPNFTCVNDNRNVNFWPNRYVQNLLNCDLFQSETLRRIKAALNYTHTIFHQHQEILKTIYLKNMEKCLTQKIKELNFDKKECKMLQEKIQEFYYCTQYFFNEVQAKQNERLKLIFEKHFCPKCFEHMDQLHENYAIIALQGAIEGELPLKALAEAAYDSDEDGEKIENTLLKDFVKKLFSKNININILHTALKGIISQDLRLSFTANQLLNRDPRLGTLESHLYDLNKALFAQIDEDHLTWRNNLKEDSTLTSEFYENEIRSNYTIILGKQLGKKQNVDELDNNIFFEIKECYQDEVEQQELASECAVWITINKALPGIRDTQSKSCSTISPSSICFIDNEGRFALVEKLQPLPLGSVKDNEAKKLHKFLAGWIKWLIQNSMTPDRLNVDNFMLAKHPTYKNQVVMTSVKLTHKLDEFSYPPLEQFVYDLSKGDNKIYQFIMNESGLSSIDDADYIKKSVHATFNPEFDPNREAIGSQFKDESTPLFVISLQKDVIKLRDDCIKFLKLNKVKVSKQQIEQLILKKYQEKGCITFIWPSIQTDIQTEITKAYT